MYDQYKNMLIRKFLLEVNYLPTYTVYKSNTGV